ncbi:MAG: endonuclease III [Acidobacteria bacterium]|nr:endonuclease III [Acidobacteriota bacterium]
MTEKEKRRLSRILRALARAYPDARCELDHAGPLELLVATILSAQCTDGRVNRVTRSLFRKYRKAEDYASAPPEELEQEIRSTGFYRAKTKSIQGACRMLVEKYGGTVPSAMGELVRLPGVARKTANVVLGTAFGKAQGIVVDTHVFRVARRLDLARAKVPDKVEQELMNTVPRRHWIAFSHRLIFHGRYVCKARKPLCLQCAVRELCNSKDKSLPP